MVPCQQCGALHDGSLGSGRFCSKRCSFDHRNEILSRIKQKHPLKKTCPACGTEFEPRGKRTRQKMCTVECARKFRSPETRSRMSASAKQRCSALDERVRLKKIGRFGGFGKKGKTRSGIRYESKLELACFELLESLGIEFIPHRRLPDSARSSDLYIPKLDLWIELDGINREAKKQYLGPNYQRWLQKLQEYKEKKLRCKVIYSVEELHALVVQW